MLPLGTPAPLFSLPDTISGSTKSYTDIRGEKGTVVIFSCSHSPFVIHLKHEIVNVNYPQDGPEKMSLVAKVLKYPFPYLYDEDQSIAKKYDAACTPDFYIFNKEDKLVYRGRMDGSRPGNDLPVTGADLRSALDAVLLGIDDISPQIPSAGCNIKWK